MVLAGAVVLAGVLLLVGCAGETPREASRGGASTRDADRGRVTLVGIDGGSWNLIDPLIETGALPNLAAVRARGVHARLATVEPVISPTVWTSIATGRRPEAHGVEFFYAQRTAIRVPTIWQRFAGAGLRVGLYEYLITWPPPELPGGFVVPGWLRRDDRVSPPDLFARAGVEPYTYSIVGVDGPDAMIATVERETERKPRTWNALAAAYDLDVGAVVFYAVDAVSHQFWHEAFPDQFPTLARPPEPRFAGVIEDTLRRVDAGVGEILAAAAPEDEVVIVSDHGFQASARVDRRWAIHSAKLFELAGVDPARDGVTVVSDFAFLALRLDPGPEAEREATLERLASLLGTLRGPAGEPLFRLDAVHLPPRPDERRRRPPFLREVIARERPAHAFLFATPIHRHLAPLDPGAAITIGGKTLTLNDLATGHQHSGEHHPEAIFLAAGGRIRHRPERLDLSVLDVAPLLTYLAGQPIPDDLEGRLPDEILDPDALRREPPRTVPAALAPLLVLDDGAAEGAGDREIDERLRTLGYL